MFLLNLSILPFKYMQSKNDECLQMCIQYYTCAYIICKKRYHEDTVILIMIFSSKTVDLINEKK